MGLVKKSRQPYRRGDRDAPDAYITLSIGTDAALAMTIPPEMVEIRGRGIR
jgi:hypothetical protein